MNQKKKRVDNVLADSHPPETESRRKKRGAVFRETPEKKTLEEKRGEEYRCPRRRKGTGWEAESSCRWEIPTAKTLTEKS